MISVEEALNLVNEETKLLGTEKVALLSSLNRVLAENIYSKDNLPPFNKSAMDGYAVKSEDTKACEGINAVSFKIVCLIKAGEYYEGELKSGEAIKIMTGAAVPKGADAVIQIEKVIVNGDNVILSDYVEVDTNIIKMGEEIKNGQLALEKNSLIRPTEIGFLASLGYSSVEVYKIPKIAIITTGDELLDIDDELENGKIRNSNRYSLEALAMNLGAEVLCLGTVEDNKDVLKEKVLYALKEADIVISSGGVSAGDYDFVEDVLMEIGAEVKFNSVAIKPGKPITFAVFENKLFFGLPGNPLAVITTFEEFVKPAALKMMGKESFNDKDITVIAANDFIAKKARRKYVYVHIKKEDGKYYAYEIGSQCSNHLMTMSRANGIIIIPEGVSSVKIGEVLNGRFIFK